MADEPGDGAESGDDNPREKGRRFQRLGEQLTGLLDPEAAFRRGSGIVTGVTQATKEEFVRIVSAEMRNFLDKMDAAELVQQVIAGLVIDVSMQVRFSKDGDGPAQPQITRQEAKIRLEGEERGARQERKDKDERRDEATAQHPAEPRSGPPPHAKK